MAPQETALIGSSRQALIPAALILFVAVFPPHVHAAANGIALAVAALLGILVLPQARGGPSLWWSAILIVAALAINVSTSIQVLRSIEIVALFLAYLFIFLFCSGLRDGKRLILASVSLSGTLLGGLGLYQSLTGLQRLAAAAGPDLPEAIRARLESGRAIGTFGLPGALAGFLLLSIPITASWLRSRDTGASLRLLGGAALLIQVGALLATRSAAATATMGAALALVLWPPTRGEKRGRRLTALALVIVGVAAAWILLASRMSGTGSESEGAGPFALRAGNMTVAADLLAAHPLFGTGLGCYGIAFPAYRTEGMNESRYAHNSYLQLLSEAGMLLGGLVLVAAAACAVVVMRRAGEGKGEARYLAAACLAFLMHNLLDFTLYLPSIGMVFFCIAGLACAPRHSFGREPIGLKTARILAALLLASIAVSTARSDLALERARLRLLDGRLEEALTAAREATEANPIDPEAWSFTSHLLLDRSAGHPEDLPEAEELARRASRLDPFTPHHWHHLGRVRLARGDTHGAYLALSRAAELYPMKIEYRRDRDSVAAALSAGVER